MKAWELANMVEALPPDSNIDILHVTPTGQTRSYSVVNVSEDQLGSHLIVASKRQLLEDSTPNCSTCGRKLRNPNTRKEYAGEWYCWYRDGWDHCWDRKVKESGV